MSKSKKVNRTKEELPEVRERKYVINGKGGKVYLPPTISRTENDNVFNLAFNGGTAFEYFGTCHQKLIEVNSSDLGLAIGVSEKSTDDELKKGNAALAFIADNKPQDSIELMLLSQMYAVHNLTLKMSARAVMKGQVNVGVEQNVNRVSKLARTFNAQVEALNKHRNKGKQKIIVQHVYVNEGGQAVVGDINQGGGNE